MTPPKLITLPDYQNSNYTLEHLCRDIKNDIFLADQFFFPNSPRLSAHQMATYLEYELCKFIFHQAPRGSAKSYTTARYILLKGLQNEISGIITAPTFRQSLIVFRYMVNLIKENSTPQNKVNLAKELDGNIIAGGMEARIRLKDGTIIKALPMGGTGEKLRGERADILYCDEFFKMESEMFKSHLLPFLQKPNIPGDSKSLRPKRMESKLIVTTSAEYEDCFAYSILLKTFLPKMLEDLALQRENPNHRRRYSVIDWNIDDLSDCGFPLEEDILELQISDAPEEEKQRVLYNKWKGLSGQIYSGGLVEKLERDWIFIETSRQEGGMYALSVDVAFSPKGDDFVIIVWKYIGNRKAAIVNCYMDKGLSQDEIALKIHEFNNAFQPEWIYMDKGGGGLAVQSSLSKRKIVLPNNAVVDISHPILLHDEITLFGQRNLILNKPSDSLVRKAFSGERSMGGEEIRTEEILVHLMHERVKQALTKGDPDILIPANATEIADDYARSEVMILDNIRECIYQLRLLTIKTQDTAEGEKEIVRTRTGKVPVYQWKRGKKDGAVTLCYGIVPYLLHYLDDRGETIEGPTFIVETKEMTENPWLWQAKEDPSQIFSHFNPLRGK